jgi:hypothetical protein
MRYDVARVRVPLRSTRVRPLIVALLVGGAVVAAVSAYVQPPLQAANAAAVLRVDNGRDDAVNAKFAGELLIYYARAELSRPGALTDGDAARFQLALSPNSTAPFADVVGQSTIIEIVAFDRDGALAENTANALVTRLSEQLEAWQKTVPRGKKIVLVTLPRSPAVYAGGSRARAAAGVLAVAALGASAVVGSLRRSRRGGRAPAPA